MLLVVMAASPMFFGDEGGLLGEWKQDLASPRRYLPAATPAPSGV